MKSTTGRGWIVAVLAACVFGGPSRGDEPAAFPTVEQLSFKGIETRVGGVAFSPDGKTLAAGSRSVVLWDTTTGRQKDVAFDHPGNAGIDTLALSPDGKWVVTGSSTLVKKDGKFVLSGMICVLDSATGKEKTSLETHGRSIGGLALAPDGRLLASGGEDGRVRLWEMPALKEKASLEGHDSAITAVVMSPNGKLLATAEYNGAIRLWDLPAGKHRATLTGHRDRVPIKGMDPLVRALAFSPDNAQLASGDYWGHLTVWDVAKEKPTAEFALPDSEGVHSLGFTTDGKSIAVGGSNTVRFMALDGKKELGVVKGHNNGVYALAFSADGKMMATGDNFKCRLWAVPEPK